MPRLDGTGPMGKGQRSGRMMGNCVTNSEEENVSTLGCGFGRGMGNGMRNRGNFGSRRNQNLGINEYVLDKLEEISSQLTNINQKLADK